MTKSRTRRIGMIPVVTELCVPAGALADCCGPIIQDRETGEISLKISMEDGARLLAPEISMQPASFRVMMEGPNGENLEKRTGEGSLRVPGRQVRIHVYRQATMPLR